VNASGGAASRSVTSTLGKLSSCVGSSTILLDRFLHHHDPGLSHHGTVDVDRQSDECRAR